MFGRKKQLEPIVVREYDSVKKYEKDAREMLGKGYTVLNVATPGAKPATMLLGGIGLLAPQKLIVTYQLNS